MPKTKENIWNVPNALTMLRMLLIPVYWFLFTRGDRLLALCVFVAASLTDLLDGYIARKYQLITSFGKLMDPLADKMMVVSVMLSLVLAKIAPLAAMVVIIVKELLMVLGGVIMLKKGVVVFSQAIGKAAQAVTVSALILCFFAEYFAAWGLPPLHVYCLWAGVALTLCALVFYARSAYAQLRALK